MFNRTIVHSLVLLWLAVVEHRVTNALVQISCSFVSIRTLKSFSMLVVHLFCSIKVVALSPRAGYFLQSEATLISQHTGVFFTGDWWQIPHSQRIGTMAPVQIDARRSMARPWRRPGRLTWSATGHSEATTCLCCLSGGLADQQQLSGLQRRTIRGLLEERSEEGWGESKAAKSGLEELAWVAGRAKKRARRLARDAGPRRSSFIEGFLLWTASVKAQPQLSAAPGGRGGGWV